MADNDINPKFVERIDGSRRLAIGKMVKGTAFAVPVIASFALNGLAINEAHAQVYASNVTRTSS